MDKKFKKIGGGVCAPEGFFASGIHCGLRKNKKKPDLALIYCDVPCEAAAVYTKNKVKGAPILVTREHLKNSKARAVIVNSGNANTCNIDGEEKASEMCSLAARAVGITTDEVLVASTGIIGEVLPIEPIKAAIPQLAKTLAKDGNRQAREAILTTDLVKKETSFTFELDGVTCTMGGMAKGSGMIHPNMATMLCFMTTDINITSELLQKALSAVTEDTFNMVSVDGDTSTNDMALIMASRKAVNTLIDKASSKGYKLFVEGLHFMMENLSKKIAKDGEGATKLLECNVCGAKDKKSAKAIAKSVITSSLFKSAMFGQDPNWGRILCAVGYSEAQVDIDRVKVCLCSKTGEVIVCENGRGVSVDLAEAFEVLTADEIRINITLGDGKAKATAWGCDLTYDYVKINAAYHT